MSRGKIFGILHRRLPWYLVAKILLSLVLVVSATTISVNITQFQAEHGASINYTNNFTAVDLGVSKLASSTSNAGTNCGSSATNVTFTTGTPKQANTNLTANHYAYTIQVNTTRTTPAVSCFTVTLALNVPGNTNTYNLKLATGSSPAANQTANCIFDIGSSIPASPYSFNVSVQ